jgi:hypothetical protein
MTMSQLDYCVKNKIIPFISDRGKNILIITVDLMKELKLNQSIENLTSLKDVDMLLDFKYANKTANGKKMRALEGTREKFIKFINADMT